MQTMNERWTPGPWKQMNGPHPDAKGGHWIGPAPSKAVAFATAEADARLIAAAPEMAELLEALALAAGIEPGMPPSRPNLDTMETYAEDARALLSRIRGEGGNPE